MWENVVPTICETVQSGKANYAYRNDKIIEPGLGTLGKAGRRLGVLALQAQHGVCVGDTLFRGQIVPAYVLLTLNLIV